MINGLRVNPYPAKLNNLNFHPLEVVSRYQLQVGENYTYLFNLRPKHLQMFKRSFHSQ